MTPAFPANLIATDRNSNILVRDFLRCISSSLVRRRTGLEDFFKTSWPVLEPNRQLIWNWHIPYLVEHLEAVTLGQILRLIINLPPRTLKSKLISIIWPDWSWTFKPWLRWIFASYSASLSLQHSRDRRRLIESHWYQKEWGDTVSLQDDQNRQDSYENTQRGSMTATSVGGSITGKGCDVEVFDDLINPEDAESKVRREAALDFYRHTLATRLDDKKTGAIVGVEQRLHVSDWTATALKEGGWKLIKLPMEAPQRAMFVFPLSGRTYERQQGELLNPTRDTFQGIAEQKIRSGSRAYSAQFQQEPINKEGDLLKYQWWKFYKRSEQEAIPEDVRPQESLSAWGWDSAAETGQSNDYTAGIRIALVGKKYRVTHIINKRLEYPEMKRRVAMEFASSKADMLLIEDSSNGKAVIQDFKRSTSLPVIPFQSVRDKSSRVNVISPLVEAGLVELPEDDLLVSEFMDQCAAFPNGEHDDMVDAFVIALMQLSGKAGAGAAGLYILGDEDNEDLSDE